MICKSLQNICSDRPSELHAGRAFAGGLAHDVPALLRLGRPATITALHDLRTIVVAALELLRADKRAVRSKLGINEPAWTERPVTNNSMKEEVKQERRRLQAAAQKIWFLLTSANETLPEVYQNLAFVCEEQAARLALAADSSAVQSEQSKESDRVLNVVSVSGQEHRAGRSARVVIEEL